MNYTQDQITEITQAFDNIDSHVERLIFDHYFDIEGNHKDQEMRYSGLSVQCPSCKGAWTQTQAVWDLKYRKEVANMKYESDLDRVDDETLKAVLILAKTRKITAIKMLRAAEPHLSLFTAKAIVERCSVQEVVTYEVTRA